MNTGKDQGTSVFGKQRIDFDMDPADPITVILQYFPPISLPADPNPEADSFDFEINETVHKYEPEADSISTNISELIEDKLVLKPEADDIEDLDEIDNHSVVSEQDGMKPKATGIDALVSEYGLIQVKNIFNKIEYQPEIMQRVLHAYEADKTKIKSHRQVLKDEILKLKSHIRKQEGIYKTHLINIALYCPPTDVSRMKVLRKKLLEFLTLDQLAEIVIEMKDMTEVTQQRSDLKEVLRKFSGGTKFKTVCEKLLLENTWDYVQRLLMPIEAERGECGVCYAHPKQYAIKDCGHYYLCRKCKKRTERNNPPKCAMCRSDITEFIKIYE